MQRIVLYIIFIFGVHALHAQQVFEGKITYISGSPDLPDGGAVYFFSAKKLRIDVYFSQIPGEKPDSVGFASQLYFPDSNIVYILDHHDKTMKRIFIDSIPPEESSSLSNIYPEHKVIIGYTCYGIDETIAIETKSADSSTHIYSMKQRAWYAKDLVTPIAIIFPQLFVPMIENHRICLQVEGTSYMDNDSSAMTLLFFTKNIEPGKLDDSVFSIPANYKLIKLKISDFMKDSSFIKVELVDIKQVETDESPPPPPPPKPIRKTEKAKTPVAPLRKPVKSTGSTKKGVQ